MNDVAEGELQRIVVKNKNEFGILETNLIRNAYMYQVIKGMSRTILR